MGAIDDLRSGAAWTDVLDGPVSEHVDALVRRTPLIDAPSLAASTGAGSALVKAEGLQRTGSFKIRGAAARLAALTPEEAGAGVVCASAGNHGLGVAAAARAFGLEATVLVPAITPEIKRAGIVALGARVEVYGAGYDEAEAQARRLAHESGAVFVSGFDDDHVMAGNGGTLAREIQSQTAGGVGAGDVVVVPVGGGGLASGIAAFLQGSGATLIGVEPETNHAMRDSFDRGSAVTDYPEGGPTMAEGLEGAVAQRTFAICREGLADIVLVGEQDMRTAIAYAYRELGLVLEASAAASVAAVLDGRIDARGGRVICIATGSNIEPNVLDEILRAV